jgi:hypothetical protein
MSPLTAADDSIHQTLDELSWREAAYFDFFDPATRISAFGYLGVHPNQQIGDVIFALWREDVLLAHFTRWDFNIPKDIGEERFCFGPLAIRPVEAFKAWNMFYDDGACRLDLDFHAIHPPYNWADAGSALSKSNSHHYEQQGCYKGMLKLHGMETSLSGYGARDHAWGWGARDGIQRWIWMSAQFSRTFCCNSFQLQLADGRDVLYGYIFRGQHNDFVRRSRMRMTYSPKNFAPEIVHFDISSASGDSVSGTARVINAFSTSFQERNKTGYHFFCFAEYESEGRIGHGQTNVHWRLQPNRPDDWAIDCG